MTSTAPRFEALMNALVPFAQQQLSKHANLWALKASYWRGIDFVSRVVSLQRSRTTSMVQMSPTRSAQEK